MAYVRGRNLYIVDIATQTEQALTEDTDPHIRNGKASWVYYEEVFGRNWRAFWWSPDSRYVAFCRYDETGMPMFHAVDTIPLHGELDEHGAPQAGRPEPSRRIGRGPRIGIGLHWIDLSNYTADNFLITHVGCAPGRGPALFLCTGPRRRGSTSARRGRVKRNRSAASASRRKPGSTTRAGVVGEG